MEVNLLLAAKKLAEKGFHVFPLYPHSKLPAIKGFPELATRDPLKLERWWAKSPLYNIGISTSRFGENESLLAVDVDNKGKKKGTDELLRLELEGKTLPATFEQLTPTTGRHLIYRVKDPIKQGVDVLGPGLDIRARGGYLVGAGSIIESGIYVGHPRPVTIAPEWLVNECGKAKPKSSSASEALPGVEPSRSAERAIRYLLTEAPLAVEGANGDQTTYRVASRVKDHGVDALTCFSLLLDHWNERCSPPWTEEALSRKVENAYAYGREPVGVSAPETQFDVIPPETPISPIQAFNKEFAWIGGNKGFVLHETTDEEGLFTVEFIDVATFHNNEAPRTMQFGEKPVPISRVWIKHPDRRSYKGFSFTPGKQPRAGFYNLWRGFAYEPLPKGAEAPLAHRQALDAFLEHSLENICDGDAALHRWLMGWFAHLIQRPWEKPLTAIVFKGLKGVGKNALIERVKDLLGHHGKLVSNSRYLTGNFNAHLEGKLLLILDEAFWSGDKQANGILKDLITGRTHTIERKGQEAYETKNLTRVAILGNENWLIPASEDERRYAVFNVGNKRRGDKPFFKMMRESMESGGYRLLMRYLLEFDLSQVDVDIAPKTAGLLDQKHRSLSPVQEWWHDCLVQGKIVKADFPGAWPDTVSKDRLRSALTRYLKDRGVSTWHPAAETVTKDLGRFLPSLSTKRVREDGERVQVYVFPTLRQARAEWDKFMEQQTVWEFDDEEEEIFS